MARSFKGSVVVVGFFQGCGQLFFSYRAKERVEGGGGRRRQKVHVPVHRGPFLCLRTKARTALLASLVCIEGPPQGQHAVKVFVAVSFLRPTEATGDFTWTVYRCPTSIVGV